MNFRLGVFRLLGSSLGTKYSCSLSLISLGAACLQFNGVFFKSTGGRITFPCSISQLCVEILLNSVSSDWTGLIGYEWAWSVIFHPVISKWTYFIHFPLPTVDKKVSRLITLESDKLLSKQIIHSLDLQMATPQNQVLKY